MSTLENEVRLLKRANQNFEEEATNFKINIENKTAINNDKDAQITEMRRDMDKKITEYEQLV